MSFTVTGPSGSTGFGTVIIPKSAVPFGTTPEVYIDNQLAQNQSFNLYGDNYYVWYLTHFSTHQISIIFNSATAQPPIASVTHPQSAKQPSLIQAVYGAIGGIAIALGVVAAIKVVAKDRPEKNQLKKTPFR